MRGPPPKPTAIKAAEGNPGKRRLNQAEPSELPQAPACPKWLDEGARQLWHTLVPELMRLGVLRELDQIQLASLCDAYSTMIAAREAMAKLSGEGRMLVKTPNGAIQQNPLLSIVNGQKQIIGRLAAEFGLTPAARARLLQDAAAPPDTGPTLEEILSKAEEEAVARALN